MINGIIRYFDLQSATRGEPRLQAGMGAKPPVLLQYAVLVAGIVIDPYYHSYATTGTFGAITWIGLVQRALFSLVTGIIIFPTVYRHAFDDKNPTFLQLCPLFVSGIGWHSLISSSGELISKATH